MLQENVLLEEESGRGREEERTGPESSGNEIQGRRDSWEEWTKRTFYLSE